MELDRNLIHKINVYSEKLLEKKPILKMSVKYISILCALK